MYAPDAIVVWKDFTTFCSMLLTSTFRKWERWNVHQLATSNLLIWEGKWIWWINKFWISNADNNRISPQQVTYIITKKLLAPTGLLLRMIPPISILIQSTSMAKKMRWNWLITTITWTIRIHSNLITTTSTLRIGAITELMRKWHLFQATSKTQEINPTKDQTISCQWTKVIRNNFINNLNKVEASHYWERLYLHPKTHKKGTTITITISLITLMNLKISEDPNKVLNPNWWLNLKKKDLNLKGLDCNKFYNLKWSLKRSLNPKKWSNLS